MKHPTISDIERYSRRAMGFFESILTGIHMRKCGQCSSMLEKLKEDDRLIEEIRIAVMKQSDSDISESDSTFVSLRKVLGEEGHSST